MTGATVTARGEAVVPGRPDEGIWTIEVDALDATPDAALSAVGERSDALSALLEELGVPKEVRSTSGVSVREEFDYADGKQVHRGYRAQNLVTVRLADASIAGRMIQGSIERAKASVRGPTWWIAPDNPARVEACRRAAVEARRKAEAYADALGLRLGGVVEVREPSPGGHAAPRPAVGAIAMRAVAEPASVEVDPGELNVQAQVEVTFFLEG
ncbi:MAG TPA: SIMPL domain-containing protein [Actinomycetota bacterium]|nr:SIMPL domain-containing protein [Actinomycetota bacterium]